MKDPWLPFLLLSRGIPLSIHYYIHILLQYNSQFILIFLLHYPKILPILSICRFFIFYFRIQCASRSPLKFILPPTQSIIRFFRSKVFEIFLLHLFLFFLTFFCWISSQYFRFGQFICLVNLKVFFLFVELKLSF